MCVAGSKTREREHGIHKDADEHECFLHERCPLNGSRGSGVARDERS